MPFTGGCCGGIDAAQGLPKPKTHRRGEVPCRCGCLVKLVGGESLNEAEKGFALLVGEVVETNYRIFFPSDQIIQRNAENFCNSFNLFKRRQLRVSFITVNTLPIYLKPFAKLFL